MQLIENPWGVTAFGAASVKSKPDLVRVRFEVSRIEPQPAEAFALVNETVRAVRRVLRDHGVPDSAVQRSGLDLSTAWNGYGADRTFRGHECTASLVVESRNLDDTQQLLTELIAAGVTEIKSVDFDTVTKPDLRARARREAVAAARRKAELYADAAGVRLGQVVHIEDVDPERPGAERHRGHGGGGETSAEDLAPGQVVVSAAVTLGFAIAAG
ncbi:SIMPL domain-containing protein [Actinoplanes sp. NPDC023801]|uniref:SIMPL domain-containing protein n=1 Tax=Actinoplanes sp. NPDC023801 TaxID=3154595 RepID=UPI0033FC6B76